MLVFEKIKWINLLSTGNSWNEVVLNKNPTTLIVGKNGHGKSTLLDALCFALFGKPFRNINKPNLVNSINGKNMKVELEFTIGPKKFKIIRGMAPNIFEVVIDDVLQKQDAVSDYQAFLEDTILKFNYKAFTQIVILGSKSFVPFMKLKAADRRGIIENLLDIEIFSSMNKIAKDKFNKVKEDVATNKTNIENTKSKIDIQQQYLKEAEKQTQEQIDFKLANIAKDREVLASYEIKETELLAKLPRLKELISYRHTFEEKLHIAQRMIDDKSETIAKSEKEIFFYDGNSTCPTCKQTIDEEFRLNAKTKVLEDNKSAKISLSEAKDRADKWTKLLVEIRGYQAEMDTILNEISDIHNSKNHINKYIAKLEAEIKYIQNKKVLSEEMMDISKKLVDELDGYVLARTKLVEDQAYYQAAVQLLKDGAIKAQIIKQYLPIINNLVNKYLSAMDFFVAFELNEEFEETIKSRHRDDFTYDSFSEGEKQRIDLAILFAWRSVAKLKNSINTNLLIMDEIFDSSLDGMGADLVLSILSTLPEGSNVFVISHRELLGDKFNETIRFEKRNNFSEIVETEI